jgi:hypothetical protein
VIARARRWQAIRGRRRGVSAFEDEHPGAGNQPSPAGAGWVRSSYPKCPALRAFCGWAAASVERTTPGSRTSRGIEQRRVWVLIVTVVGVLAKACDAGSGLRGARWALRAVFDRKHLAALVLAKGE